MDESVVSFSSRECHFEIHAFNFSAPLDTRSYSADSCQGKRDALAFGRCKAVRIIKKYMYMDNEFC